MSCSPKVSVQQPNEPPARYDEIYSNGSQGMRCGIAAMKRAAVELSEYDPEWPAKFEAEKDLLMGIIGGWLCGSVEHIGSTAVPGLTAKPVIDVMFGVKSLEASMPAIDVLVNNGYEYFAYKADVMHWFCKPSDAYRTHHLHLVPYRSPLWNERVKFRELLRANWDIASEYATLKRELAARYKYDRETYTEKKWPFIQRMLAQQDRADKG